MGNGIGCCVPGRRPEPVTLNIYDLHGTGSAIFKNMNVLLRAAGTGAFHVGVEVFGQEWSYGYRESSRSGVYSHAPRESDLHSYRESIFMGETLLGQYEVERLMEIMSARWKGDSYDMLSRNCCHFCEELCMMLDVDPLPDWLNSLAALGGVLGGAGAAPGGAQDREALEASKLLQTRVQSWASFSGDLAPDGGRSAGRRSRAAGSRSARVGSLAIPVLAEDTPHQRDPLDPDAFKEGWRHQVQARMAQAEQVSDILARAKTSGELERLVSRGYERDGRGYDVTVRRRLELCGVAALSVDGRAPRSPRRRSKDAGAPPGGGGHGAVGAPWGWPTA